MGAERDWLRNHVFPRLEEELLARRHLLEPIDLRLGVETGGAAIEESREIHVLKVCLDEIRRSRPYLIVLLGDRYGWVPPEDLMAASAREHGFHTDLRGKSVTALEVEYGILKERHDQRLCCFFYFRDPLPYTRVPKDIAARYSDEHACDPGAPKRAAALRALKERLERDPEMGPRVRHYRVEWDLAAGKVLGLEAWGEQVFRDLWGALDVETAEFASRPPPSWEETERAVLAEFVEHRSRGYVGRVEEIRRLLDLALSPAGPASPTAAAPWGACVTGGPGSGKSALFARLCRELRVDTGHPEARKRGLLGRLFGRRPPGGGKGTARPLVLAHAASVSPRASQVDAMLRRWIGELEAFLGTRDRLGEKADNDEVDAVFVELLARAAERRRVVVLLDALDAFEPTVRARHLTWLNPKLWPAGARLIATSLPGDAAEALSQWAGIEEIDLPPLDLSDAERISRGVWARYHREPNPEVLRSLHSKRLTAGGFACGNPLWLLLANEQLNLLDADDFDRANREYAGPAEERLLRMVLDVAGRLPADVEGLYDWMLAQAEKVHGAPWIKAFAALIATSRSGWREADLHVLVPAAAGLLAPGVRQRAWSDLKLAAMRRAFRAHLVRRGSDGQWDFYHAQGRAAARARYLADGEALRHLHGLIADHLERLAQDDSLHETEMMHHLREADDRRRAARYYGGDLTGGEAAGATAVLAERIIASEGEGKNREVAWIASLPAVTEVDPPTAAIVCNRLLFDLDAVIETRTTLPTRLALHSAVRRAIESLSAFDRSNARWQRDLAVSHQKVGDLIRDQGDLTGALREYRIYVEIAERLEASDPSNVLWQNDLVVSHERVGDVLRAQGDLPGALREYLIVLEICERVVASDPSNVLWQHDLAASHERVGHVLSSQGDLPGALRQYRTGLEITERLAASDPSNTGWEHNLSVYHLKVGDTLRAQGGQAGALREYRIVLEICGRLAASDPSNLEWQHDIAAIHERMGNVISDQGDLTGALREYRIVLEICGRLAASDPSNVQWQQDLAGSQVNVGNVLCIQGDLDGGLQEYRNDLKVRESLAASDPSNAEWQHDLSVSHERVGDVLRAQGDLAGALREYRMGLETFGRLGASDPSNSWWQRGLAVSHERIGDVLRAQGDLAGALGEFRADLKIAERLASSDPSNVLWQNDLAVSHERIGDVLSTQGDLEGALGEYRTGLKNSERLAASDAANPDFQRHLSVNRNNVGDILSAQGDLEGALGEYRACLKISERLAASDPSNTEWQHDLSISHERVGDVLSAQGNHASALGEYGACLMIRKRLVATVPSNAAYQRELSVSYNKVGNVMRGKGEFAGALEVYRTGLEIAERLVALDPSNAEWQRDLAISHDNVGDMLRDQRDHPGAMREYRAGSTIFERLAASAPSDARLQRDLWVSCTNIANLLETAGDTSAREWWGKAYDVLSAMRRRSLFVSPDDQGVLEQLRRKATT